MPAVQDQLYARRPLKDDMCPVPGRDGYYRLVPKIAAQFGHTLRTVRASLKDVLKEFETVRAQDKYLEVIDPPTLAMCYAVSSLSAMRRGDLRSFPQFVAFWRAHQRAVLELEAFVNWFDRYFEKEPRDLGFKGWNRCGVIVAMEEMDVHWPILGDRMRLPVYTILNTVEWDVPSDARRVVSSYCLYSTSPSPELSKSLL